MINDPYLGTTHNSDLTVIMPVFVDGEHLFWTAVRAHQNNTGEASFGYASTSVWQDGIQIPPVRIFERGREIRSTIRFYLRNVRLPDWLEGRPQGHGRRGSRRRRSASGNDGDPRHRCRRADPGRDDRLCRAPHGRRDPRASRWRLSRGGMDRQRRPGHAQHPHCLHRDDRRRHHPRRLFGQRPPGRRPLQRDRGHDGGLRQHSGAHHHRPHHPAQRGMHAPHPGHGACGFGGERALAREHVVGHRQPRRYSDRGGLEGAGPSGAG